MTVNINKTNKLQRAKGGCLGTGKPTKDAVSCENLRGDANNLRAAGLRMGKPNRVNLYCPYMNI